MMRSLLLRALFAGLVLIRSESVFALDVVDLGPIDASDTLVPVGAINDNGEVAGVIQGSIGPVPFTWKDGVMTPLPMLPGTTFVGVTGINDSGQVVGVSTSGGNAFSPLTWQSGAISVLPTESGAMWNLPLGINNNGQIVGVTGPSLTVPHSVLWQGGTVADINSATGTAAYAINDSGLVVGGVWPQFYSSHWIGFTWQSGTLTNLAPQGVVAATGVNNEGDIVGYNYAGNATNHAILIKNGVLTDLGPSPSGIDSLAVDINNVGQIIGENSGNGSGGDPFVWQNGKMTLLNSLLPAGSPWSITKVFQISDHNQIIGTAHNSVTKSDELVLLTVPEPATLSTAASALAILTALIIGRRSRR